MAAISSAGNVTGSNLLVKGDIQMLGGDFTVGANTIRFWDNSAPVVGTDAFLYVSGAIAAGSNNTVFGGRVISSGSYITKDSAGNVVAAVGNNGIISGSSDLLVGGNITGSNLQLTGDIAVLGGDITTNSTTFNIGNTTPTTINIGNNASNLYLGKTGTNRVIIQGNLLLNNNEIQASGGATGLTFPSGNPSAQFAANLTVVGDLAVNGGDLTTTAASFNLVTGSATTVNFAQSANSINVGKLAGNMVISSVLTGSSAAFFGESVTIGGPTVADLLTTRTTANIFNSTATTVNIGGAATSVNLGASSGRTTVNNDLAIGTGTIIGAPGSGANVMTLISSGNIIAKIDTDNSVAGHKFAVQDYRNIDQFSIGENGNAEVSGSLLVTGSLTTSGTLRSVAAIGDEGGEIFLAKPITNTFISGSGITIDVYQNKIRIFEEGSPNKGGFWNIGDLTSGVGTNLRTAGGSQYTYRSVTTNDTMTSTDAIIGCNHSAAITVKLPLASDCGPGQFFIIKDEAGLAATYNIVLSKSLGSSDTIDGLDAYTLNSNSASVTLYRGGTGKFFIT